MSRRATAGDRTGIIAGLLKMDQSADPTGGLMPFIDVRLDFRTASGTALRYQATLDAAALLPTLETSVSAAESPMQWDLGVMANVRRDVPFAFALGNGDVVSGFMQHRTLNLRADVRDHELSIVASINIDHPAAKLGLLRFGYSLPIGQLLWRHAAMGAYPDLVPESAPHCQIEELRSGDASVPPSLNVRVE